MTNSLFPKDLILNDLTIPVIINDARKPFCDEEFLEYFSDYQPHQIVFIGDRLLTDIVLAKRAKVFSILVTDLISDESRVIKLIRNRFERPVLSRLKKYSSFHELDEESIKEFEMSHG